MTTSVHMKFPDEFADTFRSRSKDADCFPAQRVQALERFAEREDPDGSRLAQEIAQVKAEADLRHRDGARLGGQGGATSDYLTR